VNELDVAIEAARAAGALHAARSSMTFHVEHKSTIDLVTEVDRACEDAIRAVLARHTPDIPVLGEEGGGAHDVATRWVVDPLDGTTNFVHGYPFYAVSIALEVDGKSEVGVILDAVRRQEFTARRGAGAACNGARLRVSDRKTLATALVGTGFPYDSQVPGRAEHYVRYVAAVLRTTQGIRRAGAASLDLAWVAAGALDAFWEFSLKPWDVAAGRLLVEEAGGRYSAHDGGPDHPTLPSPLATNGALHDAMIALLGEVTRGASGAR